MELNFDEIFKISVCCLKLNRSYPTIKRDTKWFLQFILMYSIIFFVFSYLAYCIIFYDLKNNDFTQACTNGILSVVFTVVTFKYFIMLWYQKILMRLIEKMKRDFEFAKNLSYEEQCLVLEYAKRGRWVSKLWLLTAGSVGVVFPAKAFILMGYYVIIGEFRLIQIYNLTYPPFIESIKDNYIGFTIIFSILMFYDFFSVIMYIGFAPMGPIFMLHTCGQLEILKRRIQNLFADNGDDLSETRTQLKIIVKHLQEIYHFVDDIKYSFEVLYEIILKTTAFVIPITFYEIIDSIQQGRFSLEYCTFIFGGITLCYVPCYYGDLLMEKGESLRQAVYMSGWERYRDRSTRSTLVLMLSRAAKPLAIRTVFRIVCLDAFTELCHQSYAIFNVLNAVWD
uniref:Odorant receptor n=1 Tax=Eogystia hippophaecolus TaxID=1206364 RepID=A0A1B3P5S5_EOGHI|nr:odorant receptor [Eogystia hippophaecolus]